MALNAVEAMARLLGLSVSDFLDLRVQTPDGLISMAEFVRRQSADEGTRSFADPISGRAIRP